MSGAKPDTAGIPVPPPTFFVLGMVGGQVIHRFARWSFPEIVPHRIVGVALLAVGIALALWAIVEFRRFKTSPEPWRPTTHLLTGGPFQLSRNPIYLAMALLQVGLGFYWDNPWTVVGVVPVLGLVWFVVIRKEEIYLERKFGEHYREYRGRVGRWIR